MSKLRVIPSLFLGFGVLSIAAADGLSSPWGALLPAVVIGLLVLINGLFVAAEFAIIAVRESQIDDKRQRGGTATHLLNVLQSRKGLDQYIATAQAGVTAASLALAMYGLPRIAEVISGYAAAWLGLNDTNAGRVGFLLALALLVFLHVVFGEMVPKALALLDAPRAALLLDRPMMVIGTIFYYPVLLLNTIGNGLLRLLRVPPAEGHERLLAPEELEQIVTESAEGGLIEDDEVEIIRNIFDFSERTVGQVMTPRRKVQAVPLDVTLPELLTLVTESRHSRFPVVEGDLDHVVGILHLKDLVRQTVRSIGPFDLRLILRAAPEVPEDFRVDTLLTAFKKQRLHMAIVRDEFGGMAGIVTLEDLVEEVVGEVRDEFDQESEPYEEIAPGLLEISGDYLLDYLSEDVYLGDEEDLPDVETVGGLIISLLGRPPQVNDEVTLAGDLRLVVLEVEGLAVVRVRVEFPTPPQPESTDETNGNG